MLSNGAQDLSISGDGSFYFPESLPNGTAYTITVTKQPSTPSQTCAVTNSTGSINGSDALAEVTCTTNSYLLQGTVVGLLGSGLRLESGALVAAPQEDGGFSLGSALSGSSYAVRITAQPTAPSQTCEVDEGTGIVGDAEITTIRVRCEINRFRLSGVVSGLNGTGLMLRSSAGDVLTIDANGAFAFPTPIASGLAYSVAIAGLPATPAQTCLIGAGSGVIQDSDVALTVTCEVNRYRVRGVLSGLAGSGLVLRLNGTHDLVLNADGAFAFDPPLLSTSAFTISIPTQPTATPPQTCTPNITGGTIAGADIDIRVTCTTSTFAIRGTVTGLVGSRLVLHSRPGGQVAIDADGTFTFPDKVPSGTAYSIDVVFRPEAPVQTCVIEDDTGVVDTADVSVEVRCLTDRFAYFVSQNTDRIYGYTINSNTGTLLPLASLSFATGDAPAGIAIDPSGTFLYVTNSGSNTVSGYRIDSVSGALSALPGSPYPTGAQPIGIAIDPSGHFVYVSNYTAASISGFAIDSASGGLTPLSGSPYAAGGPRPVALAVSPRAPFLYVMTDRDSSSSVPAAIRRYDIQTNGEIVPARLPPTGPNAAPDIPASLVFDPEGRRIYATGLIDRNMFVYDVSVDGSLSSNRYVMRAPGERIAVHPSAPFAFVSNTGTNEKSLSVFALDTGTGAPTEIAGSPFETGQEPNSIAIHPDGSFVFVTDIVFGGVRGYRIDVETATVTRLSGSPFELGQSFNAVAIR